MQCHRHVTTPTICSILLFLIIEGNALNHFLSSCVNFMSIQWNALDHFIVIWVMCLRWEAQIDITNISIEN